MLKSLFSVSLMVLAFNVQALAAAPKNGRYFDRVITVIFENTNFDIAMQQPFFNKLGTQGALMTNFMAMTHPSQGNYIALTSGSLNGVTNDNPVDINSTNIVDLLEAKGITWKVYVEDYPENCFTGATRLNYARKHNPFISYLNIQRNAARCANIVNASHFDTDAAAGTLPEYVFYVPNNRNSGHDTGVTFADKWYAGKFSSYIANPNFMNGTILVSTFDESGKGAKNQIYTSLYGPGVKVGAYADNVNTFSLLALIEDNWSLGNLGRGDATAVPFPNMWQQ